MVVFKWLETTDWQTIFGACAARGQLHRCMGCAGDELVVALLHSAAHASWLSSTALTRRHVCDCPIGLCLLRLYECPGEAKICNLQLRGMQGLAKRTSAAHTRAAVYAAASSACSSQQPGSSAQTGPTLTVRPRASLVEPHNKMLLPA